MGQVILSGNGASSTSSGAVGIPTSICMNLRMNKSGPNVSLQWKDPNDTVVDGQTLCTWGSTVIVRKQGSYPESESDGAVIATNTIRNQHNLTALADVLPDTVNEYFYRAFPISVNGAVCLDGSNKFGSAIIYEFIIKPSNSYPYGKIEYCGKNANFKPGFMDFTKGVFDYGDWKDTFIMDAFKPVMLKQNGTVDYYLNPYNMAQKLDGTASDATNTAYAGNVMVQIGQIWIKEVLENGLWHIYIANQQVDSSYDCLSHINKNNQLAPYYYYAKYNGTVISNIVRSISGQAPSVNLSGETQRTYCKANGAGHDCREASFLRLMTYLHLLIGHSTNVQEVFGTGRYTGGTSDTARNHLISGLNDDKGMFYGDNANGTVTTFFMDNLWGNVWDLTVGIIQKNGKLLYKMTPGTYDGTTATDYNTDGTGYVDSNVTVGQTASAAFIKDMSLISKLGLVPSGFTGGSATTYFCDGFWTAAVVGFARTGGCSVSNDSFLAGLFSLIVHVVASSSNWGYGVSLSYKPS